MIATGWVVSANQLAVILITGVILPSIVAGLRFMYKISVTQKQAEVIQQHILDRLDELANEIKGIQANCHDTVKDMRSEVKVERDRNNQQDMVIDYTHRGSA